MVNAICKNPRVKWIYTRNEAEAADGRTDGRNVLYTCTSGQEWSRHIVNLYVLIHFSDPRRNLNQLTRKCDMHMCHDPKSDGELLGDAPRARGQVRWKRKSIQKSKDV